MELNITSKGIDLTEKEKHLIQRKLGKLGRRLGDILETKVEIVEETTKSPQDRFLVRVAVIGSNTQLHGEDRANTILTAVDKVAKVMERQAENHKGKMAAKKGESISRILGSPKQESAPQERNFITKKMDIKPMATDEAADQMELLEYTFFFFHNTDTEKLSLLYKRKGGNYGLIEPTRG